jgi:hypothetical protein
MKKGTLKTIAIALAVGAGAVAVFSYAAPRIPQLNSYPWLPPTLMVVGGVLLARRGRMASGIGLAGAGGAVGFMLYGPSLLQKVTGGSSSSPQQTAGALWGHPDAGAGFGYRDTGAMQGGRDSGWYDRPALPSGSSAGAGFGYDSSGPGEAGNIEETSGVPTIAD